MTLPSERTRSILGIEKFLKELMSHELHPDLSDEVRQHARWCLRHFPAAHEISRSAEACPDLWDFPEKLNKPVC